MLNYELHEVIGDRIRELSKIKEKSLTKMIETCELNRNFMYDLSKGKTLKSSKNLVDIADFFDCSVDFLLGRSEVIKINSSSLEDKTFQKIKILSQPPKMQIKQKKYIRVQPDGKAAAGVGTLDDTASEAKIPADYQDINSFGVLEVVGDSMQPTLFQGDAVVFKRGTIPPTGRLVCVHFKESDDDDEGKYIIKELKRYSDSKYVFKSHNPDYEDKVIPASHIIGIGKVVHIAHDNK